MPVIIRLNYISNIKGEIIMTDNEKITGVPIDDALDKVAGGVMYVVPSERENHAANAAPI